jgi:tetratricopeptide (TPR) repeat protein
MLDDYEGVLEDFDKVIFLEPNNALILGMCGDVKMMLDDYQGALEDFDKADVHEPNTAIIL